MRTHDLKTWPSYFAEVGSRKKTFEVRLNDRDFAVGDELILSEYDPTKFGGTFTGDQILTIITYVLHGGRFGIQEGHCVLGFNSLEFKELKP